MSQEFEKVGLNKVASEKGFTVEVRIAGGVIYRDRRGENHIDCEWLVNPPGIILYERGFESKDRPDVETIFSNVVRALEYLGHRVEIWTSPSG